MGKKIRKKSNMGFSLVEIIVASLLLAIISVGIFSVTLSARKVINKSHRRRIATEVAQTALENLRAYLDWVQWNNATSPIYTTIGWRCSNLTNPVNFLNMTSIFGTSEFATKYNGEWCYKIENAAGCPDPPNCYRKATVEVNWTEIEP